MATFRYYPDLTEAELLSWRRKISLSELAGEVMSTAAGDQSNTKRRSLSTDELKKRINHDLNVIDAETYPIDLNGSTSEVRVSFAGLGGG